MDLIKLRQALNIFLQILHAINKVKLCCPIFSIKFSSVGSIRRRPRLTF